MRRGAWLGLLFLAATLSVPKGAGAFEYFDGRLQIHGFGEAIVRVLNNNFSYNYDLSQMQFVLNLEMELDIAPDGVGPFSALSAYSRLEVRYDCIWRKACYLNGGDLGFVGDDTDQLPNWRTDGRESKLTGTTFGDPTAEKFHTFGAGGKARSTLPISGGLFKTAFENKGPDQKLNTIDDPAPLVLGRFANYQHALREVPGSEDGWGNAIQLTLRPKDDIPESVGLFRFHPNAVSPLEEDESCAVSTARPAAGCRFGYVIAAPSPGNPATPAGFYPAPAGIPIDSKVGELAFNIEDIKFFRPYPLYSAATAAKTGLSKQTASGLYFPSRNLSNFLANNNLSSFDQNFSQEALSWNFGASQQDWTVLRELYFDMEMLDGRLWVRAGRQTIVWGKTEIFRSQDQFNPQDLGLATLPSLEESRIPLWAIRAVWSFYDVGPLQDVRLEVAALVDEFQPVDLGTCGETYTPRPVFNKCLGLFAHSAVGFGIAGETRPPNFWNDVRGLEFGARLEFRWRRFSFAITDYYGYNDFPTPEVINKYSRNVDPYTGRPRFGMTELGCDPERGMDDGCLGVPFLNDPYPKEEIERITSGGLTTAPGFPQFTSNSPSFFNEDAYNARIARTRARSNRRSVQQDMLLDHPANQTFFNFACANSVGFTDIIADVVTECALNIFGSNKVLDLSETFNEPFDFIPVVAGLSSIFGGSSALYEAAIGVLSEGAGGLLTVVPLNHNDLGRRRCLGSPGNPATPTAANCFVTDWDIRSRTAEGYGGLWGGIAGDAPGANVNVIFSFFGSLATAFTPEQQAIVGCGAYYASSCDRQGVDLLNAEASALFQSWPGFDGTPLMGYRMTDKGQPAPGTLGFEGGPVCTRYERGKTFILPGCRGPGDEGYDPRVDGAPYFSEYLNNTSGGQQSIGTFSDLRVFNDFAVKQGCPAILTPGIPGDNTNNGRLKSDHIRLFNPLNCQAFKSEMAAFSFNFLAIGILFSTDSDDDGFSKPEDFDEFDPSRPYDTSRCSLATPQKCSVVRSLLGITGVGRNDIRAGGSKDYGRRDFTWHGGQQLALTYDKRNVLGFSTDFSEDWSKTNWGVEATWFSEVRMSDRSSPNGLTDSDVFNLTISVDRPTFINFLNANRTLLFNAQAFISYVPQYNRGFTSNGSVNVLATFTTITGYFQDRLFAVFTLVFDLMSESGGALPSLTYRFSERFSATFGMAIFYGRWQERDPFLMPAALQNRAGQGAYKDHVENGLAVVRDRDEFFFRLRYTF